MKNRQNLFVFLYYPAVFIIALLLLCLANVIISFYPLNAHTFGNGLLIFLLVFFVVAPCVIAVASRFSLLKWRLDPFVAAVYPLLIVIWVFSNTVLQTPDLATAISRFVEKLINISSLFSLAPTLIISYIFVLASSYSVAGVKGESVGFKLLSKLNNKN